MQRVYNNVKISDSEHYISLIPTPLGIHMYYRKFQAILCYLPRNQTVSYFDVL